jgi:hypothetical protein
MPLQPYPYWQTHFSMTVEEYQESIRWNQVESPSFFPNLEPENPSSISPSLHEETPSPMTPSPDEERASSDSSAEEPTGSESDPDLSSDDFEHDIYERYDREVDLVAFEEHIGHKPIYTRELLRHLAVMRRIIEKYNPSMLRAVDVNAGWSIDYCNDETDGSDGKKKTLCTNT